MKYWTTKDGRKLRPNQFSTEHLKNTIAFIKYGIAKKNNEIAMLDYPDDAGAFYFFDEDDCEILQLLEEELDFRTQEKP